MKEEGKFLKKRWFCVGVGGGGGEGKGWYYMIVFFINCFIKKISHYQEFMKPIFRAFYPSSERIKVLWVVCALYA